MVAATKTQGALPAAKYSNPFDPYDAEVSKEAPKSIQAFSQILTGQLASCLADRHIFKPEIRDDVTIQAAQFLRRLLPNIVDRIIAERERSGS